VQQSETWLAKKLAIQKKCEIKNIIIVILPSKVETGY
jgi:hypothetical protein